MDEQDKQLEDIMAQRRAPEMRSNLSERIIEAARLNQQKKAAHMITISDIGEWVAAFAHNFIMPRPALVMALVMILGVAVGVFMQDMTEVPEEELIFLYVENSFLFEDWL